jgi:metallo-beta-lactamase superfamily protein
MQHTPEVDQVSPGIFVWQAYDSEIKADLFSTALDTPAGIYVIDPIPLGLDGLRSLRAYRKAAGIFVTNGNHVRAAAEFAKTFSVSTYAQDTLRGSPDFPRATWVRDGETLSRGLTAIAIHGGPVGETALHYEDNGGTMVLGDALINFEPHGFGLLPAKYCLNRNLMRRSLRKLLDYTFERILFAHGTPILSGARARVEQLLAKPR